MARVLVAGGAGGVGEGIVRHLLRAGHWVVVASRSQSKLEVLRERLASDGQFGKPLAGATLEQLRTVVAHVGKPAGAAALCEQLERDGGIDVAIASIGGWWEGRLLETDAAQWDAVMDEMLRAHFVFARTFVPMLQRRGRGRYIGIGGGAAYSPIPLAAPVSIAGAAQLMLTRALRAEVQDPAIDILELVIDGPVHTRYSTGAVTPGWIELDEIGPIIVELAETGVTRDARAETNGPIVTMRSLATRELRGHHG